MAGLFEDFISDMVKSALTEATKPTRRRRKRRSAKSKITSTVKDALLEALLGEKAAPRKLTKTKRATKRKRATRRRRTTR